ncbi:MAG TPA: AAA family ATPase, partial [Patescibacteria group bacterium]|nr:AAA family ATPase [Patescibacteria group bacterium]
EATGVREYQIKRDQAINKLIRTEENLTQAETLLTEIEPHLNSLTRQVKRLEKREKIEAQLREAQVAYYGCLWTHLQQEYKQFTGQLQNQQSEMQQLEEQLRKQQAASDIISQEASRAERYQSLQKQFNTLLEQKSYLLKEEAVLKGKLEIEHQKQGELSLVWLKRKEDEITQDIHTHEAEELLFKEQIVREENELKRHEQNLRALHAEFRDEEYTIVQLKEEIEKQSHAMTIPEVQADLSKIFAEQEAFLRNLLQTKSLDEFRTLQTQGKKITERFAEFMDRLNSDDKEAVEALRVEMKQKEQVLSRLIQEREAAQHSMNELRVSIGSTKAKVELHHKQIQRSQDELASIQSNIDESTREKDEQEKNAQMEEYTLALRDFEMQLANINKQLDSVRVEIDAFNQQEEEKKTRLLAIQSEMRSLQRKLTNISQQANTIEINLARIETRQEDVNAEVQKEVPQELHQSIFGYSAQPTEDNQQLQHMIASLRHQLEVIGSVDEQTVNEYTETKKRFDFLLEQTTDLSTSIGSLEKVIDELDKTIHIQFQKNFKLINEGFQKYFKILFNGGKAKLEALTETEEAQEAAQEQASQGETEIQQEVVSLEEEKKRELIGKKKKKQKVVSGIDVMASPAGKKITHVAALSGGEKSLVSIALLCAIIAHNPSPFVVLDEVEAALDEENSEKLVAILKELSQKTQIIVITHNRVTMRTADILYGVTIGKEGKSHILSVELKEAEELCVEDPENTVQ